MPSRFQRGKIDHLIAESDTDPCDTVAWFKNAEGKILQWKMGISRDVDK